MLSLAASLAHPSGALAVAEHGPGTHVQVAGDQTDGGPIIVIPPDWKLTHPFTERFVTGQALQNGGGHSIKLAAIQFLTDQLVTKDRFGKRTFSLPNLSSFVQQLIRNAFAVGNSDLFIVQANSPADQTTLRTWLAASRIGILDYIPDLAYLVRLNQTQLSTVQQRTEVFWVGLFQPVFMLEPKLEYVILQDPSLQLKLRANFALEEYPDAQTLTATLQGTPLTVLDVTRMDGYWSVRLQGRAVDAYMLAVLPGCLWVERFVEFQLHNNIARTSTSVPTGRGSTTGPIMDVENVWAKGIRGEGQIAATADTGLSTGNLGTLHQDFGHQGDSSNPMRVLRGYALGRATWDDNQTTGGGHGTHTAGSIVGNGYRSGSTPSTNTFPTTCYAGIAPQAQFEIQSVMDSTGNLGGIPADLTTLFQTPYDDGVRVHSNSWGAPSTGAYNTDSQKVDTFVWNNKDMVITFSAGNEGVDCWYITTTCRHPGACSPDGIIDTNSIGTPATAKNCITAGASENYRPDYQYEYPSGTCNSNPTWNWFNFCSFSATPVSTDLMADNANGMGGFSSRGPCADGRNKPDLVAPGIAIISTRTDLNQAYEQWGVCNIAAGQRTYYMSMGGTSMANPLTAGSAVLVRQYYVTGWHPNGSFVTNSSANAPDGFDPSAALVKATLINGAWDMTPGQYGTGATKEIPPGWDVTTGHDLPNNVEGYGRVDLYHSLFPNLGYGATAGRVLEVHDVSPGLTTGVNDAYTFNLSDNANPLIVTLVWTDPYGATVAATELVNNLDLEVKAPGATTQYYVPNRKDQTTTSVTDTVNNVEQVYVTTPAVGTWSIRVRGTNVAGNGQAGTTTQPYALVISGITCTTPPPASLSATANGNNRIDLGWATVSGAAQYRVYRATTSGGPYTQIATIAAPTTSYSDASANGGVTYYYVVRAAGGTCAFESANSPQASATAVGACNLPPLFAGLTSVVAPTNATCTLNLAWSAATRQCSGGGSVTYAVYRSTVSGFPPGTANRIATGISGTEYSDTSGLASGTTYYYVVRATDTSNGVEDTNSVQRSGTPIGALVNTTLYSQNFDALANGNNAGWTYRFYTGSSADWRGVRTCTAHSGTGIFRYGAAACANNYANNRHAYAFPPALSIAVGSQTTQLSFWHRWQFQTNTDGAYMRISLDGSNFFVVPSAAILSGTYNGTFSTYSGWTGTSTGYPNSFTSSVVDLDAACNAVTGGSGGCSGRTVYIGFVVYASAATNLDGWFLDDVTVTADVPQSCSATPNPVQALTATATNASVELQWVNPAAPYSSTTVRFRTDGTFPTSAADGAPVCTKTGTAGAKDLCMHTTGVTNGTTYYYAAFVNNGSGIYSSGDTVSARPFDTSGAVKWAYSTGASALTPPGIWPGAIGTGAVLGVSNDRVLHAMNTTATGGDWPTNWKPLAMNGPSQARPWMVGGASREVFVASQDGHVYCVNADTGALLWTSPLLGDIVQGAPAAIFTAYGGLYNLIFACTRNATTDNRVYALDLTTGAIKWTFDNSGGGTGIGIISSQPTVDYANLRLYFTSRARGGGSATTVWCLTFTDTSATLLTGFNPTAIGDIDAGPILFKPTTAASARLYVGTNSGSLVALDPTSGGTIWSTPLGDGSIKGFVTPKFGSNLLFFSTNTKIWQVADDGGSPTQTWGVTLPGAATPSIALVLGSLNRLLVGASDGQLYQYDITGNPLPPTSVPLGVGGAAAGAPSYDNVNNVVLVGTEAGIIYAIDRSLL